MTEDVFSWSDGEDLIDSSWKKLERILQKEGFREGALKGQEESYQTGFQLGYREGYRIGEAFGFYKGLFRCCEQLNLDKSNLQQHQKHLDENEVDKACVLCRDNLTADLRDIVAMQKKKNSLIISEFSSMSSNS